MPCIVCLDNGGKTVGKTRWVQGRGPYCEPHALEIERIRKKMVT